METKPKVICVGLGRTGTLSLAEALNKLGFGPCYHSLLSPKGSSDYKIWFYVGQGSAAAQDAMWNLLKDYNSFADHPIAMHFEMLYEAYPDAKFILTTRDPAKWEASIKATILETPRALLSEDPDSRAGWAYKWMTDAMMTRYHEGRLLTDAQGEFIAHNKRVIETIPADQLLVYEVSQGWEPLVEFLGVAKPDIPFPRTNETVDFQERILNPRRIKTNP